MAELQIIVGTDVIVEGLDLLGGRWYSSFDEEFEDCSRPWNTEDAAVVVDDGFQWASAVLVEVHHVSACFEQHATDALVQIRCVKYAAQHPRYQAVAVKFQLHALGFEQHVRNVVPRTQKPLRCQFFRTTGVVGRIESQLGKIRHRLNVNNALCKGEGLSRPKMFLSSSSLHSGMANNLYTVIH